MTILAVPNKRPGLERRDTKYSDQYVFLFARSAQNAQVPATMLIGISYTLVSALQK